MRAAKVRWFLAGAVAASLISFAAYFSWRDPGPDRIVLTIDDYGTALPSMVYDDPKTGSVSAKLAHRCGAEDYVYRVNPPTPHSSPGYTEVRISKENSKAFPCILEVARKDGHDVQIEFREKE